MNKFKAWLKFHLGFMVVAKFGDGWCVTKGYAYREVLDRKDNYWWSGTDFYKHGVFLTKQEAEERLMKYKNYKEKLNLSKWKVD